MDRAKIVKQLIQADERIESTKHIHTALDSVLSKLKSQIQDHRITDSEKSLLDARLIALKAQQDESVTALFQLTQARNKLNHFLSVIDEHSNKAE